MNKLYYATQNKDKEILNKSGSGGMFYALSKYVLDRQGIVYGASFTEDFKDVEIVRCDNIANLDKLLCAKYMMSNARHNKNANLIKEDLDSGKLVLYSGLPCQIYGLKNFLQRDYDNLICVEIVCHGTLPSNIWKDYLKSINTLDKKIVSVNMRDKRFGWNDYGMSIKFEDGTEFFEKHSINKYMRAFLCDKYLNKSCYDCKFKNEYSKADLVIGDFWGATDNNTPFDKKLGINVVVVNTEKGLELFSSLEDISKVQIDKVLASKYNVGMSNKINTVPTQYNKNIFNKDNKVGILTLNFNDNIGGVLQSYALQKFLSDNYYDSTTIQSHDYWNKLSFVNKLKTRTVQDFSKIKNTYSSYIVGSDQVWRRDFISGRWRDNWKSWQPMFLKFAENWNVTKIAYSASYGTNEFKFNDVLDSVIQCLNNFDAISMRELDATKYIDSITNTQVVTTCDPTMLLDVNDYLDLCKDIPTKKSGLFTYILDSTEEKTNIANKIMSELSINKIDRVYNNVEDWLASFRDCKCVLTDSYHGVLFSIIFNKPFICIYNKSRGGSRFETMSNIFNIKDRIITSESDLDYNLLLHNPDVDYTEFKEFSKNFLLSNLEKKKSAIKEIKMKESKPVFGIISWLPDTEPARTQRITRLNKMLNQLIDLFGEDIHFMIVAQNWKHYTLPDNIKNVTIYRYNKLGILGARKTLGKHFLESDYNYLIMCDDDIVLEVNEQFSRDYFFNELKSHPDGFVFLQYGWSLTFCAVSKFIYAQSPMVDIDPERGEGYEDTVWPLLLHYKHSDKEFKLSGIKFVQHKQEFHKDHKSTWDSEKIDHKLLESLTNYYCERFKRGEFTINAEVKKNATTYLKVIKQVEKALFNRWMSKEDAEALLKKYY